MWVEAAGEPAALGHVQLHASQTVPNSVGAAVMVIVPSGALPA